MRPYYDYGGIVIYHGDCLDVLPMCAQVDHMVTDPPYSEHVHSKNMRGVDPHSGAISVSRDLGFTSLSRDVQRGVIQWASKQVRRWSLVFSDIENAHTWMSVEPPQEYVRTCFWHKRGGAPQFTGDRPAVACEVIVCAHQQGRKRWNGGGRQGFYSVPIVIDKGRQSATEWRCHTTQKPEALMAALLVDFTDVGETIIDPFMGSGTTLVAAKRLGRQAIGIERDERYCEIAARRLSQGALPLWA